jgi:rhodanese-related sulfurtransferase
LKVKEIMSISTISPKQLHNLFEAGKPIELIDVRTPVEFREVHVPFATNLPLHELSAEKIAASCKTATDPLYVICRSGSRGNQACEKLVAAGCNVVNVEGGTQAWDLAGLPVVRGKKTISLERQVRIAAGCLVVIGSALSLLDIRFVGLAAFVGAGLVFAGVTDTCGMGMMLARMPWNRVANNPSATGAACAQSS